MLRSFIVLCLVFYPHDSHGDETIYTMNGKRALHKVSERFLSFSVDPAVLLTGFNLSESSLKLAKHLSPAFVRIAGPSTEFVKYVDGEDDTSSNENLLITTSMWFGINEWLNSANLTPIFGINDNDQIEGVWNSKSILPLLEISDKLNVSCYWQLGYDCSNRTETQYKENLLIFRHLLDAFPEKRNSWKLIGSDLSNCDGDNLEFLDNKRRIISDLNGVIEAIILEQTLDKVHPFSKLLSQPLRPKMPLWTTIPKSPQPITFNSAITWAREIGEAARVGYQVVFRQPRFHELFSDTPVYWVSLLYKTLMGRTVLEMKPSGNDPDLSVYAHCTKTQNNFVRSGAITVLIINNSTQNRSVLIKFGNPFLKNTEVQSFILRSHENSKEIYLNDEKLGIDKLHENGLNLVPKLRRAKIFNYLSISVPSRAIGFFVLPVAHLSVCSSEETDLNSIMDEIRHDQNINFSDKISVTPRHSVPQTSLKDLQALLQKEVEVDEKFYKKPMKYHTLSSGRDYFLERQKLGENQRKFLDFKRLQQKPIVGDFEEATEKAVRELELELTSAEVRKILADRAKTKAAKKNIIFTSDELDEILEKATDKFLKNSRTSIKIKRKIDDHRLQKRGINLDLLKEKTEILPNVNNNRMRKNYFTSSKNKADGEFERSNERIDDTNREVFIEMADSKESTTTTSKPTKIKKIKLPELPKWKPLLPLKLTPKKLDILKPADLKSPQTTQSGDNHQQFKVVRDNSDDDDGLDLSDDLTNFACIHEYAAPEFDNLDNNTQYYNNNKGNKSEMVEFGEIIDQAKGNKENKLPELNSRDNQPHHQFNEDDFDANEFDFDYGELDDDDNDDYEIKWKRSINEIDQQKHLLKQRLLNKKKWSLLLKNPKHFDRRRRQILPTFQKILEDLPIFNRWKDDKSSHPAHKSKRYINSDIDSFENEIDNDNDKRRQGESKLITMKQEQQQQMKNGAYEIVFSDKINNFDKTELELNEKINRNTDKRIQNDKREVNIWQRMIRGVTEALQHFRTKLTHYFNHLIH